MKVPSGPSVTFPPILDPNLGWINPDIYPNLEWTVRYPPANLPPNLRRFSTLIWAWLHADIYPNLAP